LPKLFGYLADRRDEESDSTIEEQGVERSSSNRMLLPTPFPWDSLPASVFTVKINFHALSVVFLFDKNKPLSYAYAHRGHIPLLIPPSLQNPHVSKAREVILAHDYVVQ
jgi:hypothetical protein